MIRLTIDVPDAYGLQEHAAAYRVAAALYAIGDPGEQLLALRWQEICDQLTAAVQARAEADAAHDDGQDDAATDTDSAVVMAVPQPCPVCAARQQASAA